MYIYIYIYIFFFFFFFFFNCKNRKKGNNTQSKTKPLLRKRYDNDFFRLKNRTKDKVVQFLMRVNSHILYIVPRYEHYPRLKYQNQNLCSWTQKCSEERCLSGNRQLTSNRITERRRSFNT